MNATGPTLQIRAAVAGGALRAVDRVWRRARVERTLVVSDDGADDLSRMILAGQAAA